MADILSQEEIDALLSATDDDYIDNSYGQLHYQLPKSYPEFVFSRKRFKHDKTVKIEHDFPVFVREGAVFQRNWN